MIIRQKNKDWVLFFFDKLCRFGKKEEITEENRPIRFQ
jgi:hypothetical protein